MKTSDVVAGVEWLMDFRRRLEGLSPEGRLNLFDMLTEGYCKHCGGPSQNHAGERCQCWNDE